MQERIELHKEIEKTREEIEGVHLYLDGVLTASRVLVEKEIPVSEGVDKAVRQNLRDIREKTGSLPTYHAREVAALSSDAVSSVSKGDLGQAAINASGVVMNVWGFFWGGVVAKKEMQQIPVQRTAPAASTQHQ